MTQITPEGAENNAEKKSSANENQNLTETEMEEDEVASISGGTTHTSESAGTLQQSHTIHICLQTQAVTSNQRPMQPTIVHQHLKYVVSDTLPI
jgi:hypothetical protein